MERNYITIQCCSVDDLRSYLRSWHPTDKAIKIGIDDLQVAIGYEQRHQNRVTIIKMLCAKQSAFLKQSK